MFWRNKWGKFCSFYAVRIFHIWSSCFSKILWKSISDGLSNQSSMDATQINVTDLMQIPCSLKNLFSYKVKKSNFNPFLLEKDLDIMHCIFKCIVSKWKIVLLRKVGVFYTAWQNPWCWNRVVFEFSFSIFNMAAFILSLMTGWIKEMWHVHDKSTINKKLARQCQKPLGMLAMRHFSNESEI